MRPGQFPTYVVGGKQGWAYGAGHLWPMGNVLPEPYHPIYHDPIVVQRHDLLRFMQQELKVLATFATIESDLSLDLFTVDPATPSFRLDVHGSPASLSATLYAVYGDIELVCDRSDAREHFAIPDPDDLMRYTGRNRPAEHKALATLGSSGFRGEAGDTLTSIVGERQVLAFLGNTLPALRRLGWKIDLVGRVQPYFEGMDYVTPVIHVEDDDEAPWFDVGFGFEDITGASISLSDIQRAINKGESFLVALADRQERRLGKLPPEKIGYGAHFFGRIRPRLCGRPTAAGDTHGAHRGGHEQGQDHDRDQQFDECEAAASFVGMIFHEPRFSCSSLTVLRSMLRSLSPFGQVTVTVTW